MTDLIDIRAHDGSRQFGALPQTASWPRLTRHLEALAGLEITGFLTDRITEGWLDFTYEHHTFAVNDQFGEYWFFVDDPAAPEQLLRRILEHCAALLLGAAQ